MTFFFPFHRVTFWPLLKDCESHHLPASVSSPRKTLPISWCRLFGASVDERAAITDYNSLLLPMQSGHQVSEQKQADHSKLAILTQGKFKGSLCSIWGFVLSVRNHRAWSCGTLKAPEMRPRRSRAMALSAEPWKSHECTCSRPASWEAPHHGHKED